MKLAPAVRFSLTLIGLVIVAGAFLGVLFLGAGARPAPSRVAVVARDINAGEVVQAADLRIVEQIADASLVRLWVQESELPAYLGSVAADPMRRGEPLVKAKLVSGQPGGGRYATILDNPESVIMTLPVDPRLVPERIARGDRINLIIALGSGDFARFPDPTPEPPTPTPLAAPFAGDASPGLIAPTPTPDPFAEIAATLTPTPTPAILMPMADLILESVEVIDVVRERRQNPQFGQAAGQSAFIEGDIQALVVRVPRTYQTVLSWAAAAGALRYAIASPLLDPTVAPFPRAGVDWMSYAELYRWKVDQSIARGETLSNTLYPAYVATLHAAQPSPPPNEAAAATPQP